MQLRQDNDILTQYGTPSRPISPSALSTPHKKPTPIGNEPGGTDNQQTQPQASRESPPQLQHVATLPSQFPPELIDHIVDHLHDDKQSLIRCSRTSRVFAHATSYHLFRNVSIFAVGQCVRFQKLIWSSLHPLASSPGTPQSSSSTPPTSPSPGPRGTPHPVTHVHPRPTPQHPHSDRSNARPHALHTCMPTCDVSAIGWDLSKFVRKIEFQYADPLSPIEVYVAEAVKLVSMLPRIREVAFGSWMDSSGMEQIARAFAPITPNPSHHDSPPNQSSSSASTASFSETRIGQTSACDPLKVHLDMVNFESVHTFLDFLGIFGGRLRELSLVDVAFEVNGGIPKDEIRARCLPGIESVYLGYDAVAKPDPFGQDGPTMGNMAGLLGMTAFDGAHDICDILESIAPNVKELHLSKDDIWELAMDLHPEARKAIVLRFPKFRKLKSVTMCVPGPHWSDLIYEIAVRFTRDASGEQIADPASPDGRASGPSSPVTSSLPSSNPTTRADRSRDRRGARVRFLYPVGKRDVDWRKLESAVSGEDLE